jgi:hypothetical protein
MILERLDLEDECGDAEGEGSGQSKSGSGHRDVPAQLPVLTKNRQKTRVQRFRLFCTRKRCYILG